MTFERSHGITVSVSEQAALSSTRWNVFFRYFFFSLLVTMSVAECLVPVWIWHVILGAELRLPLVWYTLLPFVFFGANIALLRAMRRRSGLPPCLRAPVQLYFAYAFTSIFCLIFVLLCAGVWALVWVLGQGLSASAWPAAAEQLQPPLWQALRWVSGLGIGGIVLVFVYGYTWGQSSVRVSRLRLRPQGWPHAWHQFKIAHLSDLHIGPNLSRAELQEWVRRTNALEPDIILLTGDLLDSNPVYIPDYFPLLAELSAPYGVFACLGNHDHYAGAQAVKAGLARHTPIRVLQDRRVSLHKHTAALHLIGLDDRGRDWARGLEELPLLAELQAPIPSHEPCILLSHRPDLFPQAARQGIALTLSGHTHGGQFALPGWGGRFNLARFITSFSRGLYQQRGVYLYVNRGIGVAGQRIRLFSPREIALITCEAAAHPSQSAHPA